MNLPCKFSGLDVVYRVDEKERTCLPIPIARSEALVAGAVRFTGNIKFHHDTWIRWVKLLSR